MFSPRANAHTLSYASASTNELELMFWMCLYKSGGCKMHVVLKLDKLPLKKRKCIWHDLSFWHRNAMNTYHAVGEVLNKWVKCRHSVQQPLVWFTNNPYHSFINLNVCVVCSGVQLYDQSSIKHRCQLIFSAVYISCWPPPLLWVPAVQYPGITSIFYSAINKLQTNFS